MVACPACKTDKWVENIEVTFAAPPFMTDAKWVCTHCWGYMNGKEYAPGQLLLQYGWSSIHWEGYAENIDEFRDKALRILGE